MSCTGGVANSAASDCSSGAERLKDGIESGGNAWNVLCAFAAPARVPGVSETLAFSIRFSRCIAALSAISPRAFVLPKSNMYIVMSGTRRSVSTS